MAFSDVLGQKRAIDILRKDLDSGNLYGGYLFTGPAGVGKKLVALNFAKAINCQRKKVDCCDDCSSCRRMNKMNHPNLRLISPERGSLRIEQIRDLKTEVGCKIYEGKKKIWILDESDKLTPEASNSLLKILEEPPHNLVIILITHLPALLPATVVSRCKIIEFSPLKKTDLHNLLLKNNTPSELIPLVSELAQGSIGEALKLVKEEEIFQEREKIFNILTGKASSLEEVFDLCENWSNKENSYFQTFLNIILYFLRDILLLKLDPACSLINVDKKQEMLNLKDNYSFRCLCEGIEVLKKVRHLLISNVSPRLTFEWMWMRLLFKNP